MLPFTWGWPSKIETFEPRIIFLNIMIRVNNFAHHSTLDKECWSMHVCRRRG